MTKDKKWLKEELVQSYLKESVVYLDGKEFQKVRYFEISEKKLFNLIDQLDEPEVLSQEWIDEHSVAVAYDGIPDQTEIVYVDELENLIVPKQEITFGQAHDKLREESILSEKSFDYYWNCINDNVEIDEPGNLIVSKQELPVIPKIVAEWIEDYIAKGFDLYRTLNVLESGASNLVKIYRWYRNNTLEFATAYLTNEYEVDKVRYHVRVPYSKLHYYFIDNGCTGAAGLFGVNENHSDFELTEDEINEYLPGISKEYWEEIK